jgi:hypothetical protein
MIWSVNCIYTWNIYFSGYITVFVDERMLLLIFCPILWYDKLCVIDDTLDKFPLIFISNYIHAIAILEMPC